MFATNSFVRPDQRVSKPTVRCTAPPLHRLPTTSMAWLIVGGYTVGALDMLAAFIYWASDGVTFPYVLQTVTRWFAGPAAFDGGLGTALLGAVLYGQLMWGVVALYYVVARKHAVLFRRPLLCGGIYGALAYLGIFQGLTPVLTGERAVDPAWVATCIVVFVTFVGIPCALFARRAARVMR